MRALLADAPQRIAVLRELHLGDLLCIVPALRALRAAAPAAQITLIGLPWAQAFVDRYPHYVDDLLVLRDSLDAARARHFDLALQMHGSGPQSNTIVNELGARHVAGFHRAPPTDTFLAWRDDEHEIARYLRLARELGAPDCGAHLEWEVRPQDLRQWHGHANLHRLVRGHYACMHLGAKLPSRRWSLDSFATVAGALVHDGWRIVLTGADSERELGAQFLDKVGTPVADCVVDLIGVTSLGELGAMIARAGLLVCNDTGVSHIAAAVGTPSVVISSGGDARRWAPLDAEKHRVLAHDLPCRPCLHERCPYPGHPCASAIAPSQVIEAIQAVRRGQMRHAA